MKATNAGLGMSSDAKRKAPDEDGDVDMATIDADKRPKTQELSEPAHTGDSALAADATAATHARAAAAYISFLSAEELMPPKLPTREGMEEILLGLRKKALVEEYFG
jgi:pre-mRNA-splicing factor ISY1